VIILPCLLQKTLQILFQRELNPSLKKLLPTLLTAVNPSKREILVINNKVIGIVVALAGNAWNDVAPIFDTHKSDGIHPSVADNVLIAWPEMLKLISGKSILDFGCGEGGLARELANRGHEVLGIDTAEKMIALAKQHVTSASFERSSAYELRESQVFDAISSSMVFQFVPDSEICQLFTKLLSHLKPGGTFVFAVHNPDFLDAARRLGPKFFLDASGQLHIRFRDYERSVPLYSRSSATYTSLLEKLGMKKVAESTPPFTQEYIEKYANKGSEPLDIPKFLILSFQKASFQPVAKDLLRSRL
jgi:2-polyprenyl-3-methyl-5-hydroxy-6-metoxy-1,4-benzoquinol methylase